MKRITKRIRDSQRIAQLSSAIKRIALLSAKYRRKKERRKEGKKKEAKKERRKRERFRKGHLPWEFGGIFRICGVFCNIGTWFCQCGTVYRNDCLVIWRRIRWVWGIWSLDITGNGTGILSDAQA